MLSAKPWRLELVIWFCAAQLVSLCLGLIVVGLLEKAGVAAFQQPAGSGAVLLGTLSFQGAGWVLIYFFLRYHRVRWREVFGLNEPRLPRVLLRAFATIVLILPLIWLLQDLSVMALTKLGCQPEEQYAVALISGVKSWWLRIYLGVFTVALAPVAEEFIFRGMLFPFVKQLGSSRFAWISVSILFALIHMDAATLVPLFGLALALTWLYERTDNLLAPITAHSLFNVANLLALYFEAPLSHFLQGFNHFIHLE
jgi:membrane protease YdiL (CAAX protease family)